MRHYPFKRKKEETPLEAMRRLEKKLNKAKADLEQWKFRMSAFGQKVAEDIRGEIEILKKEHLKLRKEMAERHRELCEAFPNANLISCQKPQG